MTHSECKQCTPMLIFSYLVTAGLAVYFARGISGLHSAIYLVVALGVGGLVLGTLFWLMFKGKLETSSSGGALIPFLTFSLIQAGIGYAVAKYLFNLPWDSALAFPAGAIMGLLLFFLLLNSPPTAWTRFLAAGFLAGGLVIALRLQGNVFGGLLYALALLNGVCLGMAALRGEEEKHYWGKAILFLAFLAAGRAAIQYYLLVSSYASLGVVITHPYTFVALFSGFFLLIAYPNLAAERPFPVPVICILLGILLPLALGIFIHVRPMSAYLLGLVVSGFAVGVLSSAPYSTAIIGYLSLAAATLGLPLFKDYSNLSRTLRLEVLAGIFVLTLVLHFVSQKMKSPPPEATA